MPAASYLGGMIGSAVAQRRCSRSLLVVGSGTSPTASTGRADWLPGRASPLLGVVCFGSLGIAFSHAIPNVDSAPAYVNAVFLPLIFISGVFYSADELPACSRRSPRRCRSST